MLDIMLELQRNILKLAMELITNMRECYHIHLTDFMTKFELPKVKDLKMTTMLYDSNCTYLDKAMNLKDYPTQLIKDMQIYCAKIAPHIEYYKK